jgi:hypothetical protein
MLYEKVIFELNEEVVKQHLHPFGKTYFEPTTRWDLKRSSDKIFSKSFDAQQE